ncbi:MAG: HD domain-containing protein [Gemmatimonadota bacterium]|nr:HD domain-containing protein [Gemmatimonadota bacterium]
MAARVNLSEVLSALSCALDLTEGQAIGHTMRSCLIGMRLGHEIGLSPNDRASLYYALLLKDAGCSSNAARLCQLFGTDDLELKPRMRQVDRQNRFSLAIQTARSVSMAGHIPDKIRHFIGVARSDGIMKEVMALRCERGADIAMRLGFPQATADAVRHLDEHWNGRGHPNGLAGPAIPVMSRIANLAQVVDVFHQRNGLPAALQVARARSGSWFDPALVDRLLSWRHEQSWWKRLKSTDPTSEVVAAEPASHVRWVSDDDLNVIARAFADIIDAKSPYTYAHSRNVAAYALGIARQMHLDEATQRRVYRAGLLHDIGKLGVSNSILDKPGRLTESERTSVERHPFFTWEVLSRVPAFRDFAWAAALHHERLDGTGYPWHLSGNRLDVTARILCVADVYEALTADRPYRGPLSWDAAYGILSEGRGRAFDPTVVDALAACHAAVTDMTALAPLVAA